MWIKNVWFSIKQFSVLLQNNFYAYLSISYKIDICQQPAKIRSSYFSQKVNPVADWIIQIVMINLLSQTTRTLEKTDRKS